MRGFLLRWALAALALWLTARGAEWALNQPGVFEVSGLGAVIAVAVLALVNALIFPVMLLFRIVTFPIALLTLGVWSLIVSFLANAAVLYFVGYSEVVPGFRVKSLSAALVGAAMMSLLNTILNSLVRGSQRRDGE